MNERMCESWSTNKQPLTDRAKAICIQPCLDDKAKAICKRLTDRAHQSDKLLDYDLLMTAAEVIEELQQALNGNRGDAP